MKPDSIVKESSGHPLETVGFANRCFVSWLSPLIWLANKRRLSEDDVCAPPRAQTPECASREFLSAWAEEVKKAGATKQPSLVFALGRAFRGQILSSGVCLFCFMLCQLVQPFLIRSLIGFLGSDDEIWVGFLLASAVLAVSAASSLFIANTFRVLRELGVLMKTAVTVAIYEHSMNLAASARLVSSVGQTTNLMAVDSEKLYLASAAFHFVWMTPLMVICVGALLTSFLGFAALGGWALICVLWPWQQWLAKRGGASRKKAMVFTDERIKFITEVIQGIRVAKFCGWEEAIFQRTMRTRTRETYWHAVGLIFKAIVREGILIILPPAVLAIIFGIKRASGEEVDENTALTALGFLNILRFPFNLFAMSLAMTQDALVACSRIREFLLRPAVQTRVERQRLRTLPESVRDSKQAVVDINDAAFTWTVATDSSDSFRLRVGRLYFEGSKRIVVLGRVASGKTSLLSAMLGEMHQLSGTCALHGQIAYMGQTSWIQNMSLRNNILFGSPWNEELYRRTILATALQPDIAILKDGDLTEIGERGINLSGGQKARVCLARCLYAVAIGARNTLILDCPFDALDMPTGQKVFDGIMALAKGAMLICSMSAQVHLVPNFDEAVVIEQGQVVMVGEVAEAARLYPDLFGGDLSMFDGGFKHQSKSDGFRERLQGDAAELSLIPKAPPKTLMQKDMAASGNTTLRVMCKHIGGAVNGGQAAGVWVGLALVIIFLAGQGLRVASDVLLTKWASDAERGPLAFSLLAGCACFLALRITCTAVFSRRASMTLHRRALWKVLRAPVPEYFDITTTGEIVNKFGKDMEVTDTVLPEFAMQFMSNFTQLLVILVLVSYAIPWFMIALSGLLVTFFFIARKFSSASRDLKRLDGSTRSPIYNAFAETLLGLDTIRAWKMQERFIAEQESRISHNLRYFFAGAMSEMWIMARLEIITIVIIGGFSLCAVASRDAVTPGLVGLALVYAIQLTAMFQRTCQLSMMIKQQMTACERVLSFETIVQESALTSQGDLSLPASWPCGEVFFEAVQMRYRDGDLVLRNISFKALPGERIGICGRTGAGKSSLISVLFRIVEPCSGRVLIDDVDIQKVGLSTLRRSLSIIPQEPVLFSGTLRTNLDPFGAIADDKVLVEALRCVGLAHLLKSEGLEEIVAEQGANFSHGQRQLLSIARAVVKKSRITVLDEATSAMDAETDEEVQKAMSSAWKSIGTTMLTIAHRLSTILDYDKIVVLSFGEVAEFDTPNVLRSNPQSMLSQMLSEHVTDTNEARLDKQAAPKDIGDFCPNERPVFLERCILQLGESNLQRCHVANSCFSFLPVQPGA